MLLIENGNLYIARPPLFKIKRGKDETYLNDENSLQKSLITYGANEVKFLTALGWLNSRSPSHTVNLEENGNVYKGF